MQQIDARPHRLDYLVEFPFEPPTNDRTLDKRRSATSCHLQLKTIWADSERITLRLSSAERLAKEPKPAFARRGHAVLADAARFAIKLGRLHPEFSNSRSGRRVLVRPVEAGSREELDFPAIDPHGDPVASGSRQT
jgi:hypothetical protein